MKRKLHLIIYVAIIVLLTGCAQKPRKFVIGVAQGSEDVWRDKLNDELKMGEYLNDSLIVNCLLYTSHLVGALTGLISAFRYKADEYADVIKMGRTQLQDAVPVSYTHLLPPCPASYRNKS